MNHRRDSRRHHPSPTPPPVLRFTPYAWAKLQFLRHFSPTEVGGFGISAENDPFLVEDIALVDQLCTEVSVRFDDTAVADFFDQQVDRGLAPQRFGRIWLHTHPGCSAAPSGLDEETFRNCFGRADWAVMFILAKGGQKYARLRFSAGPGGEMLVPVKVDYRAKFPATDRSAWEDEYDRCVHVDVLYLAGPSRLLSRLGRREWSAFRPEEPFAPETFAAELFDETTEVLHG